MTPPIRNVFRELDEVALRLARIERALNIVPEARAPVVDPASLIPPPIPTSHSTSLPPAPPLPAHGPATEIPPQKRRVVEFVENARRPVPPPKPFLPPIDFERLIGGRWYAVIGAIICMIGVALFLKLAYEQGWLKGIPGGYKCLFGAAFGFVLIGLGEFAFRKLEAGKTLAAAALTATGLGALFAAVYASHAVYDIVPVAICFLLLILVSAGAMILAIRQKVATVGLLGLLGAYVSPFLMGTGTPSRFVLPLYLLLLLVSGLLLSARMGPKIKSFYGLRTMVWWGTVIAGTLWAISMKRVAPELVLIWAPIVWACMHAELVYWARGFKAEGGSESGEEKKSIGATTPWSTVRAFMTSFSSTAWCVLLGCAAIYSWSLMGGPTSAPMWLVPAAAAIATGALGFVLSGHLRVLKDSPQNVAEQLGASLLVQCASALVVAIILGVSGWAEPAALLALGVGAAVAARWMQTRSLNIYAVSALIVGSFRILTSLGSWSAVAFGTGTMAVPQFSVLCGIGAISWFAIAVLMRNATRDSWQKLYGLCIISGALLWTVGTFQCQAFLAAFAMLAFVLGLALVSYRLSSFAIRFAGMSMLLVESLRILVWDYRASMADSIMLSLPVISLTFHWWGLMGIFAAVGWGIYADQFRRQSPEGPIKTGAEFLKRAFGVGSAVAGLVMLATAAFSSESTGSGLSLYWSLIVLAASAIAFKWPKFLLGLAAIPVAGGAVLAWLLYWIPDNGWDLPGARWAMLIHFGVVGSIVLAAAIWFCGRAIWENLGRIEAIAIIKLSGAVLGGMIVLLATSYDAARIAGEISDIETAKRAAVSIWWGVGGVGLIVAGFIRRVSGLRHAGLALLGLAVAKALIYDLAGVPAGWRVVSFVGLGLMMLAVSVVYAKVGRETKNVASPADVR